MTFRYKGVLVVLFCLVLSILSVGTPTACAREVDPAGGIWSSTLDDLESSGITRPLDEVYQDISGRTGYGWKDIVHDIMTGKGIDVKKIAGAYGKNIVTEFLGHSSVLGKILVVGVMMACMEVLSRTISPQGSNKVGIQAVHMALIVLAIFSFRDVLMIASEAMDNLRAAFFAFIPALTGLGMVSGAPVTASVLQPLVFFMGYFVSIITVDVFFPLIHTSVALDMAGNFGGGDKVAGVANLMRQVAIIGMGLVMASFVGVVVGQRAAAGVADGVALRTAKYMSSTFIPVAGKMIGDTMDMFFFASFGLKSAVGIAGCIAVLAAVFSPLLKIVSCLLAWRIAFAVLGPLCGVQVQRTLKTMADGLAFVAVNVLVTSFVFIICLSLVAQATRPY